MIFGRRKVAFRDRKQQESDSEQIRDICPLQLQWLRTGLSLVSVAGGLLFGAAVLRLPVEAVLANPAESEAVSPGGLLNELGVNELGEAHIARGLPENTPYAMFFSTQDESLAALAQFELFAKVVGLTGELKNPLSLPFLPLGFGLNYEGEPWASEQSAIAILPETAPRRVSPTDLTAKVYGISQVVDAEAFVSFIDAVGAARAEAPEQKVYEGATLWVWPAQTESFSGSKLDEFDMAAAQALSKRVSSEAAKSLRLEQKVAFTNRQPSLRLPEQTPGTFSDPPFGNADGYVVPGLTIAQIGDYAVMAPDPQTVKDVVDHQLHVSNLAENELFLRSQYAQQPNALLHIYANISETSKFNFSNIFSDFDQFPGLPVPSGLPSLPSLPAMPDLFSVESRLATSRLAKGITLEAIVYPQAEGLRLQGRLYGNDLIRPVATAELPYADLALQYVPAPAYSLGSSRNPAGFWQRIADVLSADDATRGFLDQARFLALSATGLDLDTELIGWLDREIAFFSFPSDRGLVNQIFPGAGVELGLAVQTSDRPAGETALDALSDLAAGFLGADIAIDTQVNDSPAVNWRIPAEGVDLEFSFLGHSWIGDDTVMFTSGIGAMDRVLNATAFEPLDAHPTFLNATRSLASPNNGYSYVNAGSSLSLIYGFIEDWFELDPSDPFFVMVKSYLGTVRGLGGTTSSTDDYWQLDSLVTLAPANREATPPQAKLELIE